MSSSHSVEFSALIYGSLVASLLEMNEKVEDVNTKLDDIGYSIGLRLAHEFARDRNLERGDTAESVIAGVLIPNWQKVSGGGTMTYKSSGDSFELTFSPSIFTQNVTVPEIYSGVKFTAMLPGVLRGVFEIFHFEVKSELLAADDGKTQVKISDVKPIGEAVRKDEE